LAQNEPELLDQYVRWKDKSGHAAFQIASRKVSRWPTYFIAMDTRTSANCADQARGDFGPQSIKYVYFSTVFWLPALAANSAWARSEAILTIPASGRQKFALPRRKDVQ
jgi:hypothetical protein